MASRRIESHLFIRSEELCRYINELSTLFKKDCCVSGIAFLAANLARRATMEEQEIGASWNYNK